MARITNALVELLAIKLFEHDHNGKWPVPYCVTSWMSLPEEDREIYRELARGDKDLPDKGG